MQLLAVPVEVEVEAGPGVGQGGVDAQLAVQHPHAAEAEHHRLPHPREGPGVDAGVAGLHVGADVDGRRAAEQLVGQLPAAHVAGQDAVGGQGQGGVVEGARLIVAPVGALDLGGELVLQQQEHDQDVGLLGHLHVGDLLLVVVAVDAAHVLLVLVLGQVDVLEGEVGAVLRDDQVLAGLGQVEAGELLLPLGFEGGQTQLGVQGAVEVGLFGLELAAVLEGLADVPGGHVVGEGVVVHMLLVLVGADHVVDVQPAVVALLQAAGPELAGVEDQLIAAAVHEVLVAGGLIVFPGAVGDVGGDVLLDEAGPDLGGQAGDDVGRAPDRGHLAVVDPGGLPGELGALVVVGGGLFVGAGQAEPAVLLQAAGDGGVAVDEVGQDEHLGVPEGVALVPLAGQALGADVHPVVVGGGHDVEVVLREADGHLVEGVGGLDGDGDVVPHLGGPGRGALGQQGVIAQGAGLLLAGQGLGLESRGVEALAVFVAGGVDGGELLHRQGAAGGDIQLELLLDDAALHDDEALFVPGLAVHRKGEGGVEHEVDAGLLGGLVVLHVAALVQALVPLREVLAAAVVHLAVDAAGDVEGHGAVQRGDADLLGDEVEPLHRDEAGEHQPVAPAVGGGPDHPADRLAGLEVEGAVIALHLAGEQAEADAVQPQVQPGDVGGVGQLGDLVGVEFVEGAGHEEVPLLAGVELVGGVAQAEVAVALAHDGFAFAQVLGVEAVLGHDPVCRAGIIHTHKKFLLETFRLCGRRRGRKRFRMRG